MAENVNFQGNTFCLNHLTEEVKFICEGCKEKACETCISTTHRGHNLIAIKLIVQEKVNKLEESNNDIQKNRIPQIRSKLQVAKESVEKIKKDIQTHIKNAIKQGEFLKELIDVSTSETVSEMENIEKQIEKKLDTFESDSENIIKQLEDLTKKCNEASDSKNNILIIDIEEHISSQSHTIKEPRFEVDRSPLKFVKEPKPESYIKAALGTIKYKLDTSKPLKPTIKPLSKPTKLSKAGSSKTLIKIRLHSQPRSVHQTKQGTWWITGSSEVSSIDKSAKKEVIYKESLIDICIDPNTDVIYMMCKGSNEINKVYTKAQKSTSSSLVFKTETRAHCINVTNNSSIFIVGTESKPEVKLYNVRGSVLQTVTTVKEPEHIAVCRATGEVAIACTDKGVMVMENNADRLFKLYTYPTNGAEIHAGDAAFDHAGHLLVTDQNTNTIHIADASNGKGLKFIKVDGTPLCLTTQINGNIAVCTESATWFWFAWQQTSKYQLKSIKYLD